MYRMSNSILKLINLKKKISNIIGETSTKILSVGSLQLAITLIGLLTTIFVGRYFGPEMLGAYSYFFGLVNIIPIISMLGLNLYLAKTISNNHKIIKDSIYKSIKIVTVLNLILLPVVYLITKNLNPDINYFFLYIAMQVIIGGVLTIITASLNGLKKFFTSINLYLSNRIIYLTIIIIAYLFAFTDQIIFAAFPISVAVILLISIFIIKPTLHDNNEKTTYKELLNSSFSFYLLALSTTSFIFIDRLAIKWILSLNELGHFTAYSSTVNILRLLVGIFPLVIIPLSVQKNYAIKKSLTKILLFILPLALILSFSSPYLVQLLYGTMYSFDTYLSFALSFSAVLLLIYSFLSSIFLGEKNINKFKMSIMSIDAFLSIPINILLNIVFLLKFGLIGSPIATSIILIFKILIISVAIKLDRNSTKKTIL